ncbi:MAG: antibiotic biosynthesis monooxygenase [Clostridia bacterium]|nr:antibiotic biosynthesis monooxygenase [Clostridia bacterium]
MIKIVAKAQVKADMVEAYKAAAKELVEKSREEEGNVFYALNVSTADPCCLTFIESWKDQAAIDFHNATEHFTRIIPQLNAMCEGAQQVDFYTEVEY